MNLAGIDIAIIAAYFVLTVAVDAAWKIMAAVGAGAGTVYMLRWFWWRVNAWSEISAMVAAFMAFLVVRNRVPTSEYQMLIIAGSTVAAWVAVTYLTPPEKPEVLEAFYRKARPGGPGWRPVAARATDVQPDRHLGVSILLVIISSGVIYLTLPAVGFLIFGQWHKAVLCLAGAAACFGGLYVLLNHIGWKTMLR